MRPIPTAPIAATSLIAGFAVAVGTGSRPLGGLVLAAGGLWCIWTWRRRHGARTAAILGCLGFGAFVISHLLGLAIGAWPSVLLVAAVVAFVVWIKADAPPPKLAAASRQTVPRLSQTAPPRLDP